MVACACNPSYFGSEVGGLKSEGKSEIPYSLKVLMSRVRVCSVLITKR
jgi:hypothetical protein